MCISLSLYIYIYTHVSPAGTLHVTVLLSVHLNVFVDILRGAAAPGACGGDRLALLLIIIITVVVILIYIYIYIYII